MSQSPEAHESSQAPKPRKPWLAGLLSLAATGVGQVYNGQWKKGVGFFAAEWLVAMSMIGFWKDFAAMLLCVSILLGYNLFVAGEAYATARKLSEYRPQPCNRWWVYALCLLVSIGSGYALESVVEGYFFRAYTSPTGSMLPTLQIGDRFMVEILAGDDPVERGQIVVFASTETEGRDFVKRVVGLPGDTVEIRDRMVLINGQPLEEPYTRHTKSDRAPVRDNFGPVVLEPDAYFLLGDNREDSFDSRWLGPVNRMEIKGRARYIYFPADMGSDEWAGRLGLEFE